MIPKCREPFITGISEAGSVDMDASSEKTTGKSMRDAEAELMQVVQTTSARVTISSSIS